jgi:hypothetical protein
MSTWLQKQTAALTAQRSEVDPHPKIRTLLESMGFNGPKGNQGRSDIATLGKISRVADKALAGRGSNKAAALAEIRALLEG